MEEIPHLMLVQLLVKLPQQLRQHLVLLLQQLAVNK